MSNMARKSNQVASSGVSIACMVVLLLLPASLAASPPVSPGITPTCSLILRGYGNRTGFKEASVDCHNGEVPLMLSDEVLQAQSHRFTGVKIIPMRDCGVAQEANCSIAMYNVSGFVFERAIVAGVYAPAARILCVAEGSNVSVRGDFTDNVALSVFVVNRATARLEHSRVCNNTALGTVRTALYALGRSGTLAVTNGQLHVHNSSFCNNTAGIGVHGGVLRAKNASIELHSSQFISNVADMSGGAIVAEDAQVHCFRCVFTSNNAGDNGGAVDVVHSNFSCESCSLDNNTAQRQGGAVMAAHDGLFSCVDCSMSNNHAEVGGAVVGLDATLTFCVEHVLGTPAQILEHAMVQPLNSSGIHSEGPFSAEYNPLISVADYRKNKRCVLQGNSASEFGGAIYADNSTLVMHSCGCGDHTARFEGGVIALNNTNVVVSACTFAHNTAERGGGMSVHGGQLLFVADTVWTNNLANHSAGALHVRKAHLVNVSRSMFRLNVAGASSGGAVVFEDVVASYVSHSEFQDNFAHKDGGGLFVWNGTVANISQSRFACNTASSEHPHLEWVGGGGALLAFNAVLHASKIECVGNTADEGGCLYCRNTTVCSLRHCRVHHNTARISGGGMQVTGDVAYNPASLAGQANGASVEHGICRVPALMHGCEMYGNHASSVGGGVGAQDGNITINESLLWMNSAGFIYGRDVHISRGQLTVHKAPSWGNDSWVESSSFLAVRRNAIARGMGTLTCGGTAACLLLSASDVATCVADNHAMVAYHFRNTTAYPDLVNPCAVTNALTHVQAAYGLFAAVTFIGVAGVLVWASGCVDVGAHNAVTCGFDRVAIGQWFRHAAGSKVAVVARVLVLLWDIATDALLLAKLLGLVGDRVVGQYYVGDTVGPLVQPGKQPVWMLCVFAAAFFAPYCLASLVLHGHISAMVAKHYQAARNHPPSLLPYMFYASLCKGCTLRVLCSVGLIFPWLLLALWMDIPMMFLHAVSGGRLFPWLLAANYLDLHNFLALLFRSPFSAGFVTNVFRSETSAELPIEVTTQLFWITVGSSLAVICYWIVRVAIAVASGWQAFAQLFSSMFCELTTPECLFPVADLRAHGLKSAPPLRAATQNGLELQRRPTV